MRSVPTNVRRPAHNDFASVTVADKFEQPYGFSYNLMCADARQKRTTKNSGEERKTMQRERNRARQNSAEQTDLRQSFNEADWVDWDHWQTVEELQNFMNGLTDEPFPADSNPLGESGESGQCSRIARQLHRHGLEIDW